MRKRIKTLCRLEEGSTHELVPLHFHAALGRALVEDELAQRGDDEAAAEHPLDRRKARVVPAVDLAVVDELWGGLELVQDALCECDSTSTHPGELALAQERVVEVEAREVLDDDLADAQEVQHCNERSG